MNYWPTGRWFAALFGNRNSIPPSEHGEPTPSAFPREQIKSENSAEYWTRLLSASSNTSTTSGEMDEFQRAIAALDDEARPGITGSEWLERRGLDPLEYKLARRQVILGCRQLREYEFQMFRLGWQMHADRVWAEEVGMERQ